MERDPDRCLDPTLGAMLEEYCFDELLEDDQRRFEAHLLACGRCWSDLQVFEPHVRLLRRDRSVARDAVTPEVLAMLGLSGRLDHMFGGHRVFVFVASALYALLFAVPVLVEVAYQFDSFGSLAMSLAPAVFGFSFLTALGAFWVDVRHSRSGVFRFRYVFLALLGSTVVLCALLLPFLPRAPTVQATFQTYPVRLGYLKSVFYAWMAAPLLAFWPFHFVTAMQYELSRGRHDQVFGVLTRDATAVTPRGTPFIPVWAMALYVAGLFVSNYLGLTHLFDNLRPGPYMSLFMSLVLIRVTAWLLLSTIGLVWYANALIELKRECRAVLSLMPPHSPDPTRRQFSDVPSQVSAFPRRKPDRTDD